MTDSDAVWVSESCTLPTVDRPFRLRDFDELFATSLRGLSRVSPTVLRWSLDPAVEEFARDLTARETECCSFFSFTFSSRGELLTVDVGGPVGAGPGVRGAGGASDWDASAMMSGLRSGEVAAAAGVNLETLRYYERRGLLAEPDRAVRRQAATACTWLQIDRPHGGVQAIKGSGHHPELV